ncbi:MAG: PAS domain S-box protein, partial [bacterium]
MPKKKKYDVEKDVRPTTECPAPASGSADVDALRESEIRYRRLFESAKDGILILDAETGVVNDVNPFLMDILGYSREQFVGATIWELGFIKNIVANKEHFEKLQSEKYIRYEDMPLETDDGRRIDVEFVSNVYLENNKKVIQCNIRDITARKRVEKELKQHRERLEELVKERTDELLKAQEQLIQSQKMEAVGQLAGGISHDFNNMLAIILGDSELVLSNLKTDDPNYARMQRVINSGKRAKDLTSRLLTFSRKEKLETGYMPIRNILLDMVDILLSSISKKIEIDISVSEKSLVIHGDVNQLGQAFLNICLNACDAMKEGGKLKLDASPIFLDDNFCNAHNGLAPGDYCLIQ